MDGAAFGEKDLLLAGVGRIFLITHAHASKLNKVLHRYNEKCWHFQLVVIWSVGEFESFEWIERAAEGLAKFYYLPDFGFVWFEPFISHCGSAPEWE